MNITRLKTQPWRSPEDTRKLKEACSLSFLEMVEDHTTCFAQGIETTVDAHSVQLLTTAAVELEHLEAGRDEPDVGEGDVGEFTAPLHGDTDAAEEGLDGVAQTLAAVEAFV